MKKKILLFVVALALVTVLFSLSALANTQLLSGPCGSSATWTLYDDGLLEIGGSGAMTSYSDYTTVPWYNFSDLITRVVVSDEITRIYSGTFRSLTSLEEITLPFVGDASGDSSSNYDVFGYIFGSYRDYRVSSSTPSPKDGAIYQCSLVDSYYSPAGFYYTYYDHYYFYIPYTLRKVTVTKETGVSEYAFRNCTMLTEVHLPVATEIGYGSFSSCSNLEKLYVTSNLTSVYSNSFNSCPKLSIYFDGSRSQYLAISGINNWNSIPVHFSDEGSCGGSVTWEINYDDDLIIDGEGTITSAGYVSYFDIIDKVIIGSGVNSIDPAKFTNLTSNAYYEVDKDNENYCSVNGIIYTKDMKKIVAVPIAYSGEIVIPDGVETIESNAFASSHITKITIPESVKTISTDAFKKCSSLTNVVYIGSPASWAKMTIESGNDYLTSATFEYGKYSISYDTNGGTGNFEAQTKTYGEALTIWATVPTKTGYRFNGWAVLGDESTVYQAGDSFTDNASITLVAQWLVNTYTVTYHANGGEGSTGKSTHTYNVEKALSQCTFTRAGYTFTGWATSEDSEVIYSDKAKVKNLTSLHNGNIDLYAVWVENKYYVAYNSNGGKGSMSSSEYSFNQKGNLLKNTFTRTGYTFEGWSLSANGSVIYSDSAEIEKLTEEIGKVITLYAVWSPITYTVTYDANGGEGEMADSEHTYDTSKALNSNTFTRIDSFFMGWSLTKDGEVVYTDKESVKNLASENGETVTLYAQWDVVEDALTYKGVSLLLDGSIGVKFYVDYNSELVDPASITMEATLTNSDNSTSAIEELDLTLDEETGWLYAIVHVYPKDVDNITISTTVNSKSLSGKDRDSLISEGVTVPNYIKTLKEMAETDESYAMALDTVVALENYCAYTDGFFNEIDMENITLTEAENTKLSKVDAPKRSGNIEGLTFSQTSLVLEERVMIRHYFEMAEGFDVNSVTVEGATALTKLTENGKYAYVDVENIPAHELSKQYSITLTNATSTMTIDFSAINYVNLNKDNADTRLSNLVKSVYRYSVEADEYYILLHPEELKPPFDEDELPKTEW